MRKQNVLQLIPGFFVPALLLFCLALPPHPAAAQDLRPYSREEISQMLAPVALYPDALLAQILMASTYPIELIEADRWVRRNPQLTGELLDRALLSQDWDPSVKAICHFPSILALMSERIAETTELGNAFLAQETEVMAVVQELRARAYAQGNLTSTTQQKVIVERQTIIIQPADPRVIYVPYYDPFSIYGPWWYPAYPPYYWGPSRVRLAIGLSYWPAISFSYTFGSWSYFDWPRRYIHIDVRHRPQFVRQERWRSAPGRWQHLPEHRRGVVYRDPGTARKYSQPHRPHTPIRRDLRGLPERTERDRTPGLRGTGATGTEPGRRPEDRQRFERERQERDRVQNNRRQGDRIQGERGQGDRQPPSGTQGRQVRGRSEGEEQVRNRTERDRQVREQPDRGRQGRETAGPGRQERAKIDRGQQQRAEQNRPARQRTDQEKGGRERAEQRSAPESRGRSEAPGQRAR